MLFSSVGIVLLFVITAQPATPTVSSAPLEGETATTSQTGKNEKALILPPADVTSAIDEGKACLQELNYSCSRMAFELAYDRFIIFKNSALKKAGEEEISILEKEEAKILFLLGTTLGFLDVEPESTETLIRVFMLDSEYKYDPLEYSPEFVKKLENARFRGIEQKEAELRQKELEIKAAKLKEPSVEKSVTLTAVSEKKKKTSPSWVDISVRGGAPLLFDTDADYFSRGFYFHAGVKTELEFNISAELRTSILWLESKEKDEKLKAPAFSGVLGYSIKIGKLEMIPDLHAGYGFFTGSSQYGTMGAVLFGTGLTSVYHGPAGVFYGIALSPEWYFLKNVTSSILATQLVVGVRF